MLLAVVEEQFLNFLTQTDEKYRQICLLDDQGFEKLCVLIDNDGQKRAVPERFLRDRSDTNYFLGAHASVDQRGRPSIMYISPVGFDSDIATLRRGNTPPVIHFASALQDRSGAFVGVIEVQLPLTSIYQTLIERSNAATNVYLVDQNGHFLYHPHNTQPHAFLFDNRITLYTEQPLSAPQILANAEGTLWATEDHPDHLQVFQRVKLDRQALEWTVDLRNPVVNHYRTCSQSTTRGSVDDGGYVGAGDFVDCRRYRTNRTAIADAGNCYQTSFRCKVGCRATSLHYQRRDRRIG